MTAGKRKSEKNPEAVKTRNVTVRADEAHADNTRVADVVNVTRVADNARADDAHADNVTHVADNARADDAHADNIDARVADNDDNAHVDNATGATNDADNVTHDVAELKTKKDSKIFVASQGRLRKLFLKSGLTGRISKDVFDKLDQKIKCFVDQRIKSLTIKDKRIVLEENITDEKEACELPVTPFRDYIKSVIKKEYDISRVPPDVMETLHYQIEKDVIKLCQYAQDIMKNSTRKTLFVNDIEVASKALLKEES